MNYILRKKLRLGSIRLKLNTTETGLSGEVVNTDGILPHTPEDYILGGRQGLYYRINHKGKRVNAHQGMEKLRGALMAVFFISLSITAASIVLWPNPWVPTAAFIGLAIFGGSLMAKDAEHARDMYDAKVKVDEALIDPETPPSEEKIEELTRLSRDVAFPVQLREDMYQAVLDQVIDDHQITQQESYLLEAAKNILALSDYRIHEIHRELISSAWLHALKKGQLQEEDFSWLGSVAEDLGLSREAFNDELDLVMEMQKAPAQQPTDAEDTSHEDSKVQITADHIILQNNPTKKIPLSSIREVELNVDTQQLLLHQDGIHKPLAVQSRHPFRLGQLLTTAEAA